MDARAIRDGAVVFGLAAGLAVRLAHERINPLGAIWPHIVLGVLGVAALALIVKGVLTASAAPGAGVSRPVGRALVFVLVTFGYLPGIEWLGFLPATLLYAVVSQFTFRARPSPGDLATAAATGIAIFLLFVRILGLPLPPGLMARLGL